MPSVAAAIVTVWVVLVAAGAVPRRVLRLGRRASALAVVVAYGMLCGLALAWLGWTGSGLLGMAGMTLPLLAGLAVALL